MTTFDLLVRATELVLIRHGIAEADLENTVDLTASIIDNGEDPDAVGELIEKFIIGCGGEPKDATLDDADFLTDLAKAL